MRVVALLALLLGFMQAGLLDGQVFTHSILGIVAGIIAFVCGFGSARKDPPHRWLGRIMAVLGVALAIWYSLVLSSTYAQRDSIGINRRRLIPVMVFSAYLLSTLFKACLLLQT